MGLANKKILVTGGLGFIGSHIVKKLLDEGSDVVVVDCAGHSSKSYFNRLGLSDKVILENIDVTDFSRTHSCVVRHKIDYIFHLAAQAVVDTAYDNPLHTLKTNILGTANILESCRLIGKIKGILVTSTDKVYGKLPRVDERKPISGDHPYEVSKSSADLLSKTYFATYGLPVVVTRFGNVYGEGDLNFSRIIPGLMKSIITSKTLSIRSNGKYVRDYVYVDDVVNASLKLIKNMHKAKGEAFNISTFENLSVLELIKKVEKILSVKVEYKVLSTAINEIPIQSINFKKIRDLLGWKPEGDFATSISNTFKWYRDYFEKS